mmetsp:Transcript_102429/g.305937  ORF Transcript_102429/g.305937 Transcript_102429/m.305937 type:complete len:213 (-) Transcript_102429:507-1145(-)
MAWKQFDVPKEFPAPGLCELRRHGLPEPAGARAREARERLEGHAPEQAGVGQDARRRGLGPEPAPPAHRRGRGGARAGRPADSVRANLRPRLRHGRPPLLHERLGPRAPSLLQHPAAQRGTRRPEVPPRRAYLEASCLHLSTASGRGRLLHLPGQGPRLLDPVFDASCASQLLQPASGGDPPRRGQDLPLLPLWQRQLGSGCRRGPVWPCGV